MTKMQAEIRSNIFNDGSDPLSFYIIPCKQKKELAQLITQHGGVLLQQRHGALYQLYNPGDIVSNPSMVSSTFINDCIAKGKLLDVKLYRYTARSAFEKREAKKALDVGRDEEFAFADIDADSDIAGDNFMSRRSNVSNKHPFTVGEDMKIINAVLKESKVRSINGQRIWEILCSRKVTNRTAMSMKERFLKKILPFIDNYDLSALEIQKLKTLISAKTVSVVKNLKTRSALPFLRAPRSPPRPSRAAPLVLSSSDDDVGLVPLRPIKRRSKPQFVELSSNSDPSSQSTENASQQSQRNEKSLKQKKAEHQRNDTLAAKYRKVDSTDKLSSESTQRESRPFRSGKISSPSVSSSQSPRRHLIGSPSTSPKPNQSAKDIKKSNRSGRGNRTSAPSATKTSPRFSSQQSYVIEQSSPELAELGRQSSREPQVNSESVDMELLGLCENMAALPKVSVRLTNTNVRTENPSMSTPLKPNRQTAHQTPHLRSVTTALSCRKNSSEAESAPSENHSAERETRPFARNHSTNSNACLSPADNCPERSPIIGTQLLRTDLDCGGVSKLPTSFSTTAKSPSKTADDAHPRTQPYTLSEGLTNNSNGVADEMKMLGSQCNREDSCLSSQSSPLFHLDDLSQASPSSLSIGMGNTTFLACLSSIGTPSANLLKTDSDEHLWRQILSDSPEMEADLWPCKSPISPTFEMLQDNIAFAAPTSVAVPSPVAHSTQQQTLSHDTHGTQLSWSTLGLNSQQFDNLLGSDASSGSTNDRNYLQNTNQNNRQPNLPADTALSPILPKFTRKLTLSSSTTRAGVSCNGIFSQSQLRSPSMVHKESSQKESDQTSKSPNKSHRKGQNDNNSAANNKYEDRCSPSKESKGEDIVNQSWSTEGDIPEIPEEPASQPFSSKHRMAPKRTNRLKEVLQQPMREPVYVDAVSTSMSQASVYVNCMSDEGNNSSELSFKSASETTPIKTQSLLDESDSAVKAEPLQKHYSCSINKSHVLITTAKISARDSSPIKVTSTQSDEVPLLKRSTRNGSPSKQPDEALSSKRFTRNGSPAAGTSKQSDVVLRSKRSTRNGLPSKQPDESLSSKRFTRNGSPAAGTSKQSDVVPRSKRSTRNGSSSKQPDEALSSKRFTRNGSPAAGTSKQSDVVPRSKRSTRNGSPSKQPDDASSKRSTRDNSPITVTSTQSDAVPLLKRSRQNSSPLKQPDEIPLAKRSARNSSPATGTSKPPDEAPLSKRCTWNISPVAGTSKQPDEILLSQRPPALFIEKCTCTGGQSQNAERTCHINMFKNHPMYSKLMITYQIEDRYLLACICGFNGDWKLLDQHLKSGHKVGNMWTQKADRLLLNPSFRKRNLKELRKKFTSSEIKTRKEFLLEHLELTPQQRKNLLGLHR